MSEPVANKYGRKGGRGLRPWLLIPKVMAVGVYLGAVTTCSVMYFARNAGQTGPVIEQVGWLFRFVVVPALLVSAGLGVALLMQHPMVFLRMRWFQAKLVILTVGVPVAHWFMSSRLRAIRTAVGDHSTYEASARQMTWGFVVLLMGSALIVFMGRHKPRLGQNWARTFASLQSASGQSHG